MQRFRVGHLNIAGADLLLVPFTAEFLKLQTAEQGSVHRQITQLCKLARLAGNVIPVWQTASGSMAFLAEERFHPVLREKLSPAFLQQCLNREVVTPELGPLVVRVLADLAKETAPTAAAPPRTTLDAPALAPPAPAVSGSFPQPTYVQNNLFPRWDRGFPTRVVTLLFTDVVDSTKLKQQAGDRRGTEIIRKHHELIRRLLAQVPGGHFISTSGDSFFCIFVTPSEAVKFALRMQNTLRGHIFEDGIRVADRVGIHVGEVFVEERGAGAEKPLDLHGIQVDSAARIMGLASADQILMSRVTADNARQVMRGMQIEGLANLQWMNHGHYDLKGVEDPIEIVEVGEQGRSHLRAPFDSDKAHRIIGLMR
jgi:class 3 adenylate cyclase